MTQDLVTNLSGKLLLAMPSMSDPRFARSVIFICSHDEKGAMGLVINAPHNAIEFKNILDQLNIGSNIKIDSLPDDIDIMEGGPVDSVRGFLLHSSDYRQKDTIRIDDDFSVTGTISALQHVAAGNGPSQKLFMLGHAGWSAGQLENELVNDTWLVASPTLDLVFRTDFDEMWERAMSHIGIDPAMISSISGRA